MFDRINVIQVDSVNVLVRSQELPLFARLGPHPRTMLADAIDDGELFEYWAHVAAIVPEQPAPAVPVEDGVGARVEGDRSASPSRSPGSSRRSRPAIRDSGPITAADLEQRVGKKGSWWSWDDGKLVLEHLFHRGEVVAVRRPRDFAREYDLPERVLPASALDAPTPDRAGRRARSC